MTPAKFTRLCVLPILALFTASLAGCYSGPPERVDHASPAMDQERSEDQAKGDSKSTKDKPSPKIELEKKERELHLAQLELEIGKAKAKSTAASNAAAVAQANFDLGLAERTLVQYVEVEAPQRVAQEQLSLDNTSFRLLESRQEQEQMEVEYGPHMTDEHAKKTGEIVIWRGQKRIEFAERRLELSKLSFAQLESFEIPQKQAELKQKLDQKQEALERAKEKAERGVLEDTVSIKKIENRMDVLEYEIGKLRAKIAKDS